MHWCARVYFNSYLLPTSWKDNFFVVVVNNNIFDEKLFERRITVFFVNLKNKYTTNITITKA